MKKTAASIAAAFALGAAGGAAVKGTPLQGTVYVHFTQELPDGGVRDLGRTGCYELSEKVKATVEACGK